MPDKLLYTATQVRELDRIAIQDRHIPGLTLMRRAAAACVEEVERRYSTCDQFSVYCGSGNNAGDGYIVAGMLADKGHTVEVLEIGDPSKLGEDATAAFQYCRSTSAQWNDQPTLNGLIIDALLGTGLKGEVRENYQVAIDQINQTGQRVLAVDIPSGLCADTGVILGAAVNADVTVTFIGRKRGLYTHDGVDVSGEVVFDDLGVPADIFDAIGNDAVQVLRAPTYHSRRKNSHKNSHGHVLIVGGAEGMGGAVIMASEAALRTGAGLVTVATQAATASALTARIPEVMARKVESGSELAPLIEKASVIVVGPGLGTLQWGQTMMNTLLNTNLPLIVDADGLNLLAEHPRKRENWILTPHPGEASRLLGSNQIQQDRFEAIAQLQARFGGVVLLKGAGTLITDGEQTSLCPFGNPGMAVAGMGDVLSGVIGGLLAQGGSTYQAATEGACLHSQAGDIAALEGERGILATDLIPIVRKLVNE